MVFELFKYECRNREYLIYDSNKNEFEFGGREARVMCSLEVGLMTQKFLVIPQTVGREPTVLMYNPDGTLAQPQIEDMKVFSKYLEDAGYERMRRSSSGRCTDESVHKICKMAFFDNFIVKYNLTRKEEFQNAE